MIIPKRRQGRAPKPTPSSTEVVVDLGPRMERDLAIYRSVRPSLAAAAKEVEHARKILIGVESRLKSARETLAESLEPGHIMCDLVEARRKWVHKAVLLLEPEKRYIEMLLPKKGK